MNFKAHLSTKVFLDGALVVTEKSDYSIALFF